MPYHCVSVFSLPFSHPIMVAAFDCDFSFSIDGGKSSFLRSFTTAKKTSSKTCLFTLVLNHLKRFDLTETITGYRHNTFYRCQYRRPVTLNKACCECFHICDTPIFRASRIIVDNTTTIATMVANRYRKHLNHPCLLANVDVRTPPKSSRLL